MLLLRLPLSVPRGVPLMLLMLLMLRLPLVVVVLLLLLLLLLPRVVPIPRVVVRR